MPTRQQETLLESSSPRAGWPRQQPWESQAALLPHREASTCSQELADCERRLCSPNTFQTSPARKPCWHHAGPASLRTRHPEHCSGLTQCRSAHGCPGPRRPVLPTPAQPRALPSPGSRGAGATQQGTGPNTISLLKHHLRSQAGEDSGNFYSPQSLSSAVQFLGQEDQGWSS